MQFRKGRAAHLRLGRTGERVACRLLRDLGMEILVCNFSGRHGELDIVARDGDTLCFVEVKTRRRRRRSRPADAVTAEKKWHIVSTARRYLNHLGHPEVVHRYDIVEVVFSRDRRRLLDVRHWPAAFSADDARRPRWGQQPILD